MAEISKVQILLVEDSASLRFVAEKQFTALGYKIAQVAEDGFVAVEKALDGKFDLIFMDVNLPGIDGIIATKRIRLGQSRMGIYSTIIGMTAYAERKLCLDSGMDDFLQKPVMLGDLKKMLSKWTADVCPAKINPDRNGSEGVPTFQQTRDDLEQIGNRIRNLRKEVGLD